MRIHGRSMAAILAAAALLATGGCGGGQEAARQKPASLADTPADAGTQQGSPASTTPQPPPSDPQHPLVVIETSLGNITVQLDRQRVPRTVDNFLSYVEQGHYDQTIFHQVFNDYPKLILGGAYTVDLTEKPTGFPVLNEAHLAAKNTRGTIAMARRDNVIDSATCHFFINLSDNEVLDHKGMEPNNYGYCVFGKVVAGLEVADAIAAVEVHDTEQFERTPVHPVVITSIRRIK